MATAHVLAGVIPPATTPFKQDGQIAFEAIAGKIDWLVQAGVAVGGLTPAWANGKRQMPRTA